MLLLLVLIMMFLTAFFFKLGKGSLLFVPFLVSGTFLFSSWLDYMYQDTWALPMHLDTISVIVWAIFCLAVGSFIARYAFKEAPRFVTQDQLTAIREHEFYISPVIYWPIISILCIFLYFTSQEFYFLAQRYTDSTSLGHQIGALINELQYGNVQFSRWNSYRFVFFEAIAYTFTLAFIYNVKFHGFHYRYLKFLFPTLFYMMAIIYTAGRQDFIYYSIFLLVSWLFLDEYVYGYTQKRIFRRLSVIIVIFLFFVTLFLISGLLSGKINSVFSIFRVLAHYGGTNISAFDLFLHRYYPDSAYIGTLTLPGVYAKLTYWGLPKMNVYITDFAFFDGISTNVYTALRRYIQDYGIVGMSIIMFILGYIYTFFYQLCYKSKLSLWKVLLFSKYLFPIFLLCREERFMTTIISTTTIYVIVVMWFIFRFLLQYRRDNLR